MSSCLLQELGRLEREVVRHRTPDAKPVNAGALCQPGDVLADREEDEGEGHQATTG